MHTKRKSRQHMDVNANRIPKAMDLKMGLETLAKRTVHTFRNFCLMSVDNSGVSFSCRLVVLARGAAETKIHYTLKQYVEGLLSRYIEDREVGYNHEIEAYMTPHWAKHRLKRALARAFPGVHIS